MKGDMSGGAAVLYAMKAIGKLKPEVNVTGIMPTAENFRCERPTSGDIFMRRTESRSWSTTPTPRAG
jgi:leucyl aminopeptidase